MLVFPFPTLKQHTTFKESIIISVQISLNGVLLYTASLSKWWNKSLIGILGELKLQIFVQFCKKVLWRTNAYIVNLRGTGRWNSCSCCKNSLDFQCLVFWIGNHLGWCPWWGWHLRNSFLLNKLVLVWQYSIQKIASRLGMHCCKWRKALFLSMTNSDV